jgi:predicted RNA-binding protein with PUA-like domain
MAYWLFKSEPDAFSWDNLVSRGAKGEPWTGVRNFQARNNMRAMGVGDLGFFYHSNEGKEVVGICEVIALAHPDTTAQDGSWECVDVKAVAAVPQPVTLVAVKENPKLAAMILVNNSRLSVQPVTAEEWAEVCRMGGLDPAKFKSSTKAAAPAQIPKTKSPEAKSPALAKAAAAKKPAAKSARNKSAHS